MKKLLASFLAAIIGTFGIACIDQEARDMIAANSQRIDGYYSEYKEDMSQIEESITQCNHICKDYDEDISNLNSKIDNIEFPECSCKDYSHLEEQYNELYAKYEKLSLICEKNKPKEYKIGDRVEIPIIYQREAIESPIECYGIITDINTNSINERYKLNVIIQGEMYVRPNAYYTIFTYLRDDTDQDAGRFVINVSYHQIEYKYNNVCIFEAWVNMVALENGALQFVVSAS